jgi:MFS family permease
MREGLRYVRERPDLQALLGLTGVTSFCIFPNMAVLTPYYANHVLNVGAAGLGSLMSVSGLGSLLGSILLLTVPREQRYARMLLAAATITVTASALAWSQRLWLSVVVIAFQSLAISTSLGISSIIVQEMVSNEIRGRVMSLYTLMFTGVIPFSSLLLTAVVDWIGMRWELQIAALLYGLGAFLLLWRLARVPEPSAGTAPLGEPSPSPVED